MNTKRPILVDPEELRAGMSPVVYALIGIGITVVCVLGALFLFGGIHL